MFRSIAALISGSLVVLVGMSLGSLGVIAFVALQLPSGSHITVVIEILIVIFVLGIGIVAGYVTGLVARRSEVHHGVGVVAVLAGMFVLSLFVLAPQVPWTERWLGLLASGAGILLGANLRHRQTRKLSPDSAAAGA